MADTMVQKSVEQMVGMWGDLTAGHWGDLLVGLMECLRGGMTAAKMVGSMV